MKYHIWIAGGQDILVLSPKIIGLLIERIRQSDKRELTIPAEILLPQGYTDYILNVMRAKMDCINLNYGEQDVIDLFAKQIRLLKIGEQQCFDKADAVVMEDMTEFHLEVNEKFFLITKQPDQCFLCDYEAIL